MTNDNDQNIQNDAPNQGAQGQFHGDVNTGTQQDVSGERAVGIGGDSNAPVTTGNGNTVTNIGNQFNIAGDDPRKPRTWTRPDVLGLLTLLVTVIGVVGTYLALPWFPSSPPAPFVYDVNVENAATRDVITNAQVTLRVGGQSPITGITDANGYAGLEVDSAYVGKRGELIIEANDFERHNESIQLEQKALPNVVQLDPIAP